MTEHTKEEIMKALECCQVNTNKGCEKCPYYDKTDDNLDCITKLCADALDLINRQKAEIEDLEIKNEHLVCFLVEARRDAIKEFAERLKEKIRVMDRIIIYGEDIDNLAKEMTEGGNG